MKMCNIHVHRPALPGRNTCKDCRNRSNTRRGLFRAQGLCFCGKTPAEGYTLCPECVQTGINKRRNYQIRGLCACGREKAKDRKHCARCLKLTLDRALKFRSQGLCYCGKRPPKKDYTLCQNCLDQRNAKNKALREQGKCICGRTPIDGFVLCLRCRNRAAERMMRKFKTDKEFALSVRLRDCIYGAIKKKRKFSKKGRTEALMGCTFEFARQHIQNLFLPGMTWDNMDLWQIDHYIPCAAFKLSDERQQRLCNNWRNLRPLWEADNLSKRNKLPLDYKERLAELEAAVLSLNPMDDPMF